MYNIEKLGMCPYCLSTDTCFKIVEDTDFVCGDRFPFCNKCYRRFVIKRDIDSIYNMTIEGFKKMRKLEILKEEKKKLKYKLKNVREQIELIKNKPPITLYDLLSGGKWGFLDNRGIKYRVLINEDGKLFLATRGRSTSPDILKEKLRFYNKGFIEFETEKEILNWMADI